jgi:putative N6-adenine-specific DNA methylase
VARTVLDCFAPCAPGVEPLLSTEMAALGVRSARQVAGGVAFRATVRELYAANLWLRTANRVLVRVGSFRATTFAELEHGVEAVDWSPYLAGGADVRVTSRGSRLYHAGAVQERVAALLGAGDQRVHVRVDRDQVVLSVDASGDHLHRRGWRLATAKAPLRETLAAALLAATWDAAVPLVDPFCGSGTIPIEAALLARGVPPGAGRPFAFQTWPSFQPGTWASVTGAARASARPQAGVAIVAADRDAGAVRATRENAERAGVAADIEVRRSTVSELAPPPGPGWLLTNPPYGDRVQAGRALYGALGKVLHDRCRGWHLGLLVEDSTLAALTAVELHERLRTTNGGIPVRLLTGTV